MIKSEDVNERNQQMIADFAKKFDAGPMREVPEYGVCFDFTATNSLTAFYNALTGICCISSPDVIWEPNPDDFIFKPPTRRKEER